MLGALEFYFLLEWLLLIPRLEILEIRSVNVNLHIWVLFGQLVFEHPCATRDGSLTKDEGRVEINCFAIKLVYDALEDSLDFFELLGSPLDCICVFFFDDLSSFFWALILLNQRLMITSGGSVIFVIGKSRNKLLDLIGTGGH